MRQTATFFVVTLALSAPAAAQQIMREVPVETPMAMEQQAAPAQAPRMVAPTPTPSAQGSAGQRTPSAAAPAAAEAPSQARVPDPGVDRSDANIKIVLTIKDASSASTTATKTITMSVANMASGRVRSSGANPGRSTQQLSLDASAELRRSGLIRVNLTISYLPEQMDDPGTRLESVNESLSVFLKDGVPTVVSQAADPTKGSRSVTIEVTATVVK